MIVAPLGAFFSDDLEKAAEQARLSAEVTHGHPEGQAGAIAIAVAAAQAFTYANRNLSTSSSERPNMLPAAKLNPGETPSLEFMLQHQVIQQLPRRKFTKIFVIGRLERNQETSVANCHL